MNMASVPVTPRGNNQGIVPIPPAGPTTELKTVAVNRLQALQDLIANEITTQIHEWIEGANVQWRNGVEVCDIMGITRRLDLTSSQNGHGPAIVTRKAGVDDDDCCIVVYNRTDHPIFVQSEFLPGTRRRLNKFELGLTAAPGAGTGTFGFEIGDVKVEAINLERLIVFPGKLTLIQVGSREQSFITVDLVYEGKEINLYTDKKMYYAQCLVIGGEPIDDKVLVSRYFFFINLQFVLNKNLFLRAESTLCCDARQKAGREEKSQRQQWDRFREGCSQRHTCCT